jgi:hypothetical protein
MRFLPHLTMALRSPLAPGKVLSLLTENTDTASSWLRKSNQPFQGSVSDSDFSIACCSAELYRNAYRPQFTGEPKPVHSGSRIAMTLTLMPSVAGLARFWFLGCGFFAIIGVLILALTRSFATAPFLGIPVLILAIGYALVHTSFRQGLADSKPALLKILQAEQIIAKTELESIRT